MITVEKRFERPRISGRVDSPAGFIRVRQDGTIYWRVIRCDTDGQGFQFTYTMPESYVVLVGVRQARWEAAQELRILRRHIAAVIRERNEYVAACVKGKQGWH